MKEKGKWLDIIIGSYKRIERIHKKADFIKKYTLSILPWYGQGTLNFLIYAIVFGVIKNVLQL